MNKFFNECEENLVDEEEEIIGNDITEAAMNSIKDLCESYKQLEEKYNVVNEEAYLNWELFSRARIFMKEKGLLEDFDQRMKGETEK